MFWCCCDQVPPTPTYVDPAFSAFAANTVWEQSIRRFDGITYVADQLVYDPLKNETTSGQIANSDFYANIGSDESPGLVWRYPDSHGPNYSQRVSMGIIARLDAIAAGAILEVQTPSSRQGQANFFPVYGSAFGWNGTWGPAHSPGSVRSFYKLLGTNQTAALTAATQRSELIGGIDVPWPASWAFGVNPFIFDETFVNPILLACQADPGYSLSQYFLLMWVPWPGVSNQQSYHMEPIFPLFTSGSGPVPQRVRGNQIGAQHLIKYRT